MSIRTNVIEPLMICAVSSALALALAVMAPEQEVLVSAFVALGIPLGAETMARYNFAAELSPPEERALDIGVVNVWLAPWQALAVAAGFAVDRWGFGWTFAAGILSIVSGIVLLRRISPARLA